MGDHVDGRRAHIGEHVTLNHECEQSLGRHVVIRVDWKPIILRGGGIGALLVLWVGMWATAFLVCWDNAWLFPGVNLPEKWAESIHYSTEEVLGYLGEVLGLNLPTNIPSFLLLMMAVGWISGALTASIARLTTLDPAGVGRQTFGWSLRAMVSRAALPMWIGTIVGVVVPVSLGIDNLVLLTLAPCGSRPVVGVRSHTCVETRGSHGTIPWTLVDSMVAGLEDLWSVSPHRSPGVVPGSAFLVDA